MSSIEHKRSLIEQGLCSNGDGRPLVTEWFCAECAKRLSINEATRLEKIKIIVSELLPNVCYFNGPFCNKRKRNGKDEACILHEKSGNGHDKSSVLIIYKNPERAKEFVRLCYDHHNMVHKIMNFGKTWDEIVYFLECGRIKYTEV